MPWSTRFESPVPVPRGRSLRTLADARRYILDLPPRVTREPEWQTAAEALLLVANHNGPTMFARIAMLRALESPEHVKRRHTP